MTLAMSTDMKAVLAFAAIGALTVVGLVGWAVHRICVYLVDAADDGVDQATDRAAARNRHPAGRARGAVEADRSHWLNGDPVDDTLTTWADLVQPARRTHPSDAVKDKHIAATYSRLFAAFAADLTDAERAAFDAANRAFTGRRRRWSR